MWCNTSTQLGLTHPMNYLLLDVVPRFQVIRLFCKLAVVAGRSLMRLVARSSSTLCKCRASGRADALQGNSIRKNYPAFKLSKVPKAGVLCRNPFVSCHPIKQGHAPIANKYSCSLVSTVNHHTKYLYIMHTTGHICTDVMYDWKPGKRQPSQPGGQQHIVRFPVLFTFSFERGFVQALGMFKNILLFLRSFVGRGTLVVGRWSLSYYNL